MTKINRVLTGWGWVSMILLFILIAAALIFMLSGFTETNLRTVVRLTARMSGLLFCMAFTASSLYRLAQNECSRWMLKNRRYLGISFALVHLVHLAFIVLLESVFESVLPATKIITILGGGIAYLFVLAMLLTSFLRFKDKLTRKQWKRLHTTGGYWIWGIFIFSYLKRIPADYFYLPWALLFMAVLLIRLWNARQEHPVTGEMLLNK